MLSYATYLYQLYLCDYNNKTISCRFWRGNGHSSPRIFSPNQALKEQLGLTDQLATTLADAPGIPEVGGNPLGEEPRHGKTTENPRKTEGKLRSGGISYGWKMGDRNQ